MEVTDAVCYQTSTKYLNNSKDLILKLQDCSDLGGKWKEGIKLMCKHKQAQNLEDELKKQLSL